MNREISEQWYTLLTEGHRSLRMAHRMFRHLPSAPRCKMCHNPFGGVGGKLVGLAGFRPSPKNPNVCSKCCDGLPSGGAELDIGVLFADVRGSTAVGERTSPREYADLLNQFYKLATDVLIRHDAIIDKLIGDEVMALFIPGIAGPDYRRRAAVAGIDLVATVTRRLPELSIGAAVHAGVAYVGNVGDAVVDFTALGDPVNVAARLQSHAAAGEVVLGEELYPLVASDHPNGEPRTLTLKGREEPVPCFVVRASSA